MAKNTIEHDGIVIKVADTYIIVAIQNQSGLRGLSFQRGLRVIGSHAKKHHGRKTEHECKSWRQGYRQRQYRKRDAFRTLGLHHSIRLNHCHPDIARPRRVQ